MQLECTSPKVFSNASHCTHHTVQVYCTLYIIIRYTYLVLYEPGCGAEELDHALSLLPGSGPGWVQGRGQRQLPQHGRIALLILIQLQVQVD